MEVFFIIRDLVLELLNLSADEVESLHHSTSADITHVFVDLMKIPRPCPHCHQLSSKTNGTQTMHIKHHVFSDRAALIHVKKFRYICSHCQKTFMTYGQLAPPNSSISFLTRLNIMEAAKSPHMPFNLIAKKVNLSVTKVIDFFMNEVSFPYRPLPQTLCIDEVYIGKSYRKKYAVVLLDFESGRVIDFFLGRSIEDCLRSLSKRPKEELSNVKLISTDMYQGFIHICQTLFPKATICLDSFHVLRLVIDALDQVIKTVLSALPFDSVEHQLLKNRQSLLTKNPHKIDWSKLVYSKELGYRIRLKSLFDKIMEIDHRLSVAYQLKELYFKFNRQHSVTEQQMIEIIYAMKQSGLTPFSSQNCQ